MGVCVGPHQLRRHGGLDKRAAASTNGGGDSIVVRGAECPRRAAQRGVTLAFDESFEALLLAEGFSPTYGARPGRRGEAGSPGGGPDGLQYQYKEDGFRPPFAFRVRGCDGSIKRTPLKAKLASRFLSMRALPAITEPISR